MKKNEVENESRHGHSEEVGVSMLADGMANSLNNVQQDEKDMKPQCEIKPLGTNEAVLSPEHRLLMTLLRQGRIEDRHLDLEAPG